MKKAFVLVVDDEVDLATVVAAALTDVGYSAAVAHDGRAGLLRLAEKPADLVLLDIMMPSPDGLAMLATMRADPTYANIPVIIMTTVDYMSVRNLLPAHQGILRKPFSHRELVDAVAQLVMLQPNA